MVNENTHEGLITTEDAETILAQLANSTHSKGRRTAANYLLTGLLKTPNGESWFGNGRSAYIPRGTSEKKSRKVDQQLIEQAVLDQLSSDLKSSAFITALTKEAQKFREAHRSDPAEDLRPEVVKIADQISKMMEMATQLEDPAPALREIDKLEKKRKALATEIGKLEQEYTSAVFLENYTEPHVALFLGGISENMEGMDRDALKDLLSSIIDQITLDPVSHEAEVSYRFAAVLPNNLSLSSAINILYDNLATLRKTPQCYNTSRVAHITLGIITLIP